MGEFTSSDVTNFCWYNAELNFLLLYFKVYIEIQNPNIETQLLGCFLSCSQLCDNNAGYGTLQCRNVGSCPGSYNGNCNPNYVWSGSMVDTNVYYRGFGLESGTFANFANSCGTNMYGKCITTWAFGVRCVLDVNKINEASG